MTPVFFHLVTGVLPLENYKLQLSFNDGSGGVVDIAGLLGSFHGVFEPLKDPDYFRRVAVDPESGTVTWPNQVDLDPEVLYSEATGKPLPEFYLEGD